MAIAKLTTLTAAALAVGAVAAGSVGSAAASDHGRLGPYYGHTPTGNITCKAQNGGSGWNLVCSAADPGRTLRISSHRHASVANYRPVAKRGPTMSYGHRYWLGPFRCDSKATALTCVLDDGRGLPAGFQISREAGYVYDDDDWGGW